MLDSIKNFLQTTGVARMMGDDGWWQTLIMFVIAAVLVYLAIVKQYEPLLLRYIFASHRHWHAFDQPAGRGALPSGFLYSGGRGSERIAIHL